MPRPSSFFSGFFLTAALAMGLAAFPARASVYIEAGTSAGTLSKGDSFFKTSGIGSTGLGFVGSLSVYYPFTSLKNILHFDIGLQNRLSLMNGKAGQSLAVNNPHLGLRMEFWRFFVGGGYAPFTYASTDGVSGLKNNNGASAYFAEGGVIWRVIPEFQIVAAAGLEFGVPKGGGTSPSPITEFGLRFRFPLNPKEYAHGGGVKFDGFRYPFGLMRD